MTRAKPCYGSGRRVDDDASEIVCPGCLQEFIPTGSGKIPTHAKPE
jgi:hypothetical protein